MNTSNITEHPILKPGCEISLIDGCTLAVINQNRALKLSSEIFGASDAKEISKLQTENGGDQLERILDMLSGRDQTIRAKLLHTLTQRGVVVENPAFPPREYNAEYLAYRLIDTYRCRASAIWRANPLFTSLYREGKSALAIGFLLETYFHVRAANVTAAPVLLHSMTETQRELLENFFTDEMRHCRGLGSKFSALGINSDRLKTAVCAPETELMERFFYSCAVKGVADFAVALIVPEIEELPVQEKRSGNTVVDKIGKIHNLPQSLIEGFKSHHHENDELGHECLPVTLLKEFGKFTPFQARELFLTLHFAIQAYDNFLRGILLRYGNETGEITIQDAPYGVF